MPKTRSQKGDIVDGLAKKIAGMKSAVFLSISGFTMADADKLRAKGKEVGVTVGVAKKTLLARALKDAGYEVDFSALSGSILTGIGLNDEVSAAKLIADFAKGRDTLTIAGGILEGKMVDAASIKALAKLPTRQQLLGQLVGTLNAPISGFVNVLASTIRSLPNVLNAIKESKV